MTHTVHVLRGNQPVKGEDWREAVYRELVVEEARPQRVVEDNNVDKFPPLHILLVEEKPKNEEDEPEDEEYRVSPLVADEMEPRRSSHKKSLAELDQEGDPADTFRRTVPDDAPLVNHFHDWRWGFRRSPNPRVDYAPEFDPEDLDQN